MILFAWIHHSLIGFNFKVRKFNDFSVANEKEIGF